MGARKRGSGRGESAFGRDASAARLTRSGLRPSRSDRIANAGCRKERAGSNGRLRAGVRAGLRLSDGLPPRASWHGERNDPAATHPVCRVRTAMVQRCPELFRAVQDQNVTGRSRRRPPRVPVGVRACGVASKNRPTGQLSRPRRFRRTFSRGFRSRRAKLGGVEAEELAAKPTRDACCRSLLAGIHQCASARPRSSPATSRNQYPVMARAGQLHTEPGSVL